MRLEGLVCKLRDTPYRSGRTDIWIKVKCTKRDIFTIVGFVEDRGSVASLHLAKREAHSLVYVGKAGRGVSRTVARDLHQILSPLAINKPALVTPVRDAKTVWVQPRYQAEIEYRAITAMASCGKGLRQPGR